MQQAITGLDQIIIIIISQFVKKINEDTDHTYGQTKPSR